MSTFSPNSACVKCNGPLDSSDAYYCRRCAATNTILPNTNAPAPRTVTEERWGLFHTTYRDITFGFCGQDFESEEDARAAASLSEVPVRVTLTYTVPEEEGR